MILTHHGIDSLSRKKMKEVSFNLFGDAPAHTGSFSDVNFDGNLISKVSSSGNVLLYFTANKNAVKTKNFIIEFDRVCYSPSGSIQANHIYINKPYVMLLRGHHEYRIAVGNKNQVIANGAQYTAFAPAYKINAGTMNENPFIVTDSPLYDKLYRYKIIGINGSMIEVYVDGVKLAEKNTSFNEITYLNFGNEVNYPVGGRNVKLVYEE